jgi:radical SAM family uncharacterized protein/radical SAM-linked protein
MNLLEYKHSLWQRLESEVLPFVSKPGRYIGNELYAIHKAHISGNLKIALCFPEMYEIGMSYMGMQILYHIINQRTDCLAERAFSVWPDMEEVLRKQKIPLFSLESSTPLSEFDVLGFHLTYEMTFTTALNMLNLAGIPLLSQDRNDSHPLILAGGPSVLNPEPMADFVDAFFIGDAEEAMDEIINAITAAKAEGLSKENLLLELSKIPGIYIPQFYAPKYSPSGRFASLERLRPDVPEKIKVRSIAQLKNENYPLKPIIPFIETTHDHLSVEIMRGCVRSCRFCQAGYQYRPRRQRKPEEISSQLLEALQATGYDGVTLLSLSSTDYDRLGELLARIGPRLSESRIGLALPSLRPETLNATVLEALSSARKSGLTLAPEAGTERLRNALGKNISDNEIYSAIDLALDNGWQTFKLYFMIGLPTETNDDLDGIVTFLRRISYMGRQQRGKSNINVALSPFNPKCNTPWQWQKQVDIPELKKRIDRIIDGVKKPNINIKYRDLYLSQIEGIIGRGDRRLGNVILAAYHEGSRLDGWSEWFDAQRWHDAFAECDILKSQYVGPIDEEAPLPWDHIEKGILKDFLRKDNQRSMEGILPMTAFDRKDANISAMQGKTGYGRKLKRVIKQSVAPSGAYKLRVRYSRGPELRYLSHLDIIRLLYRAFRRAEMPVAYSEGFHPHIKVSFGQPLPLGYTSEAEYFDLQLNQPFREEFITRLNDTLPQGIEITGYKNFFTNISSLTKQLNIAHYEIPLIDCALYNEDKMKELLKSKSLNVKRIKVDGIIELDVRKFIENLNVVQNKLLIEVWQLPDGHIKPEEILIFGLGIDANLVKPIPIHRKGQFHKSGERLIEPLDLV